VVDQLPTHRSEHGPGHTSEPTTSDDEQAGAGGALEQRTSRRPFDEVPVDARALQRNIGERLVEQRTTVSRWL
jgi:hypothetical protein